MNKLIYLGAAIVIIIGTLVVLRGSDNGVKDVENNNSTQEVEMMDNQNDDSSVKATDYNSSRSNRTTATAIDEDSDDDGYTDATITNTVDDDCDDPHNDLSTCAQNDATQTTLHPDSDDDGDGISSNDDASASTQSGGYVKIDDVKGESNRN